ncbi:TetR/AcrR family transcriptional regulator [Nocardia sp. NPDC051052]|uniref:TetR/AcrR family transcriptional regulator n=1 Tax=Nocardia sp. NPDC051052 TaxID=3364322 RepID=UPI003789866E
MPTEPHGPRSRRERPAKPALTRPGIIETAVRLMRAEGLERVTMRRLAAELDTGPASLYVYVRNTAELHAAVLDDMLAAVDLAPVNASGDWQSRLVRVLTSYTMVVYDNPGLAQSALVARPSGPGYLNLLEAILALLSEGGVPDDRAAWLCDVLLLFATANAAEHATRDRDTAERDTDALVAAVRNASTETHPRIATLGDDLLSGPGSDRLDWGFHLLINGAVHTPRPTGPNR